MGVIEVNVFAAVSSEAKAPSSPAKDSHKDSAPSSPAKESISSTTSKKKKNKKKREEKGESRIC